MEVNSDDHFVVGTGTLIAGKLELVPFPDLKQVIVNGQMVDTSKMKLHVGVTCVLCYSGSMFGYNGSPIYWMKDGKRFSDSVLILSEDEVCSEYLNHLQSNPEFLVPGKPVQSFVNTYYSDPCLLYVDRFIAILRIQSLQQSDAGTYDFHLENQDGVLLIDGKTVVESIGQSSQ